MPLRRPSRGERAQAAEGRQRRRKHQFRAVLFTLIAVVWLRLAVQGVQAFLYRPSGDTFLLALVTVGVTGGSGLIALQDWRRYFKKR